MDCDCEFCFRSRLTAPHESAERDVSVWQPDGHKSCNTLLFKCQSHPITYLSDVIAHKGMPPIKLYVCHWAFVFPSCVSVFSNIKASWRAYRGCRNNAFSDREDLWAVTVSCSMLQNPYCVSLIFLGHVCSWYSFASSLDHLHTGYIYNNVRTLQWTLFWLLTALLTVKHSQYLLLLQY